MARRKARYGGRRQDGLPSPAILDRMDKGVKLRTMRFSVDQIAEQLGVSAATVQKDWRRSIDLYTDTLMADTRALVADVVLSYERLANTAHRHLTAIPAGSSGAGVASLIQVISNIEWRRAMVLGLASDAMRRRYENMTDDQIRAEVAALAQDAGLLPEGEVGTVPSLESADAPAEDARGWDRPDLDPVHVLHQARLSRVPALGSSLAPGEDA